METSSSQAEGAGRAGGLGQGSIQAANGELGHACGVISMAREHPPLSSSCSPVRGSVARPLVCGAFLLPQAPAVTQPRPLVRLFGGGQMCLQICGPAA
jgi:hypothetical protein